MDFKHLSTFLLILFIISIEIKGGRSSAKEQDSDLESLAIQDEFGDLYECINIYKQPAFDHPLLKNHQIQMKPSSLPKGGVSKSSLKQQHKRSKNVLQQAIGCPEGTVPIRKTRKENILNVQSFMESYSSFNISISNPGQHYAVVQHPGNSGATIYGSQADMNSINPKVENNQASFAFISLWKGLKGGDEHIIQAGWGVAPQLYGDHKTHFTIFWRTDNSGCFNLLCPGFVHVDKNHPLDQVLETSTYNGMEVNLQLLIHQDPKTKNWWVTIPNHAIDIGYWPSSLLPRLADGVPSLFLGGWTKHEINEISPPMAFGYFPDGYTRRSGYFQNIQVMYNLSNLAAPAFALDTYVDVPDCYQMNNYGIEGQDGYSVLYGGTGGACGN